MSDYGTDSGSDSGSWGITGDMYHDHTETNTSASDAYGASADLSYPDGPWGSSGDIAISGEVDHDVSHEIDGGTLSDDSSWGGDASVDY